MKMGINFDHTNLKDLGILKDKMIWLNNEWIPLAKQCNEKVSVSGIWLSNNDSIYYFKTVKGIYSLLAELLGEKISRYFGLDTVHYELAKGIGNDGKTLYGLVSKYMALEDHEYQTWERYLTEKDFYKKESVHDLAILRFFEQDFSNEPIVSQTKAFFVRELLTNEDDRLIHELLINEKDQKHSLGYLVDYAPEFRLPHRYSLFVPFCYRLSLRDFDVVQKIKEDPQFQMYVEKALLLEMKKLLKEVSEEQALQIPLDIASSLENFLGQSQSILRMYLKR